MNTWICIGYFDTGDGKRMYKLQNPDTMEEKTVQEKDVKNIKNILNIRFENGGIRFSSLAQSRYNSKNDRDKSEQALDKFMQDLLKLNYVEGADKLLKVEKLQTERGINTFGIRVKNIVPNSKDTMFWFKYVKRPSDDSINIGVDIELLAFQVQGQSAWQVNKDGIFKIFTNNDIKYVAPAQLRFIDYLKTMSLQMINNMGEGSTEKKRTFVNKYTGLFKKIKFPCAALYVL